jgi:hypothetical protein
MKVSKVGGHDHTYEKGAKNTSYDDKHDHGVSDPKSGWTDYGGDPRHKHQLLKVTKKK